MMMLSITYGLPVSGGHQNVLTPNSQVDNPPLKLLIMVLHPARLR